MDWTNWHRHSTYDVFKYIFMKKSCLYMDDYLHLYSFMLIAAHVILLYPNLYLSFSFCFFFTLPVFSAQLVDLLNDHLASDSSSYYCDVIMGTMATQITSLTIVYSTVDQNKTSKLRVTGLCAGNSPVTAQMASNAENVSIWWRHRLCKCKWA